MTGIYFPIPDITPLQASRYNLEWTTTRRDEIREELRIINNERRRLTINLNALCDCVEGLTAKIAEIEEEGA